MKTKTGCGILILLREEGNQPRILLLKRGMTAPTFPGHWGAPGGLLENDEAPREAAIRETREEADLAVTPDRHPFYEGEWTTAEGGDGRRLVYFTAHLASRPCVVLADSEASAFQWATYEEALELPLSFKYREVIEQLRTAGLL